MIVMFGQKRIVGIQLEPALDAGLGVREDRLSWAFGLAHTAVDALIGVNDKHVLALVEAVDRADFNAVGIFALDAGFSDDVSHPILRKNWLRDDPFSGICVAHELRSRKGSGTPESAVSGPPRRLRCR